MQFQIVLESIAISDLKSLMQFQMILQLVANSNDLAMEENQL